MGVVWERTLGRETPPALPDLADAERQAEGASAGGAAGLCSAGDPAPTQPPKDHSHLSHKKSLLKNKVLPSFVYSSGKQAVLYAVQYMWTGAPDSQNPVLLNPSVNQEPCEDTDVSDR